MKRVITYGTYDLLHHGHISLLRRAKECGDYLIVGLSTDDFNKCKQKESTLTYEQRESVLEAVKYVDFVIPEDCWEQKVEDIQKHNIDVLVMGDDWQGKFDNLSEYCEVVYLPRTPGISTTLLKKDITQRFK
jgi:glycerol-3-phosphate cytidylyltransferase